MYPSIYARLNSPASSKLVHLGFDLKAASKSLLTLRHSSCLVFYIATRSLSSPDSRVKEKRLPDSRHKEDLCSPFHVRPHTTEKGRSIVPNHPVTFHLLLPNSFILPVLHLRTQTSEHPRLSQPTSGYQTKSKLASSHTL
ncbi:hypothetical protein PISMIDRAFT_14697 [Pisolithus microcarpus 441]|uniref:Uncharacterized protein n=1 Tax=Pisolithus microcarpus 441 TaxID=765257 RepID=A0A0C9Z6D0_9AGAM|nr:hypothetical protein PISMIDRAFT_14697 [Pisolithus microcarpus 441]